MKRAAYIWPASHCLEKNPILMTFIIIRICKKKWTVLIKFITETSKYSSISPEARRAWMRADMDLPNGSNDRRYRNFNIVYMT